MTQSHRVNVGNSSAGDVSYRCSFLIGHAQSEAIGESARPLSACTRIGCGQQHVEQFAPLRAVTVGQGLQPGFQGLAGQRGDSQGKGAGGGAHGPSGLRPLGDAVDEIDHGDIEGLGDVEEALMQNAAPAVHNIHEHVARHPGALGQFFEGEIVLDAQAVDAHTDSAPPCLPCRDPFRVVLMGAGRHTFK